MDRDSGSTRQTNNSLSASFFEATSAASVLPSTLSSSVVSSVAASVAMPVSPPTLEFSLDPAFVAAVATAVQAALTPVVPQAASSGISLPSSSTGTAYLPGLANVPSSSGGVPPIAQGLEQRMSSFMASGVAPFSLQSSPQPVVPQGRPCLSVPSFISTFATPHSAISSPAIATCASHQCYPLLHVAPRVLACLCPFNSPSSCPPAPWFHSSAGKDSKSNYCRKVH